MPYRARIGGVVAAVSAQDKALYATFERSSDPMMLLCPEDRRIVDANEAYGRLVGRARRELIGLHPWEHAVDGTPAAPAQEARAVGRQLVRHPGTVFGNRRMMAHTDGSTTLVQWSYSGVTVAGRGLLLVVGVPVPDEADPARLTEREREVVRWLALGKRGREIAAELFLSERTVETHTRNARLKLGAATKAELIAKALSAGLIS